MSKNFNHVVQGILTFLQGVNISTVPEKYAKYVILVISGLQWYVSNIASKSDPATGAKLH